MNHIKYPSIDQFRNAFVAVKNKTQFVGKDADGNPIYDKTIQMPIITAYGTVKLHGTNSSIVLTKNGDYYAQSRERIITVENDNFGFAAFAQRNKDYFISKLQDLIGDADAITVYGEWFGKGIQKSVAISELSKRFAVFGVKRTYDDDGVWLPQETINNFHDASIDVYNVNLFKTYEVEIDFNQPEYAQKRFEEIVYEVENKCPAGEYFGVNGLGEGVVFSLTYKGESVRFKCKGEKHSNSKVKKVASIDIEEVENAKEFAENVMQLPRLEQGIGYLREMGITLEVKNIGKYLEWCSRDVFKEHSDEIAANNLDAKRVAKQVQDIAKKYFFEELKKM